MTTFLIVLYLGAIVCANLTTMTYGPVASVINAFALIGLDLTCRDALHERWRGRLLRNMALLIGAGSLLSWLLARDAGPVAAASFVAFASAASLDGLTYHLLGKRARIFRVNGSNVVGAAVDSIVFPLLAWGLPFLWPIVLGQFTAKVAGGLLWSVVLRRDLSDRTAQSAAVAALPAD